MTVPGPVGTFRFGDPSDSHRTVGGDDLEALLGVRFLAVKAGRAVVLGRPCTVKRLTGPGFEVLCARPTGTAPWAPVTAFPRLAARRGAASSAEELAAELAGVAVAAATVGRPLFLISIRSATPPPVALDGETSGPVLAAGLATLAVWTTWAKTWTPTTEKLADRLARLEPVLALHPVVGTPGLSVLGAVDLGGLAKGTSATEGVRALVAGTGLITATSPPASAARPGASTPDHLGLDLSGPVPRLAASLPVTGRLLDLVDLGEHTFVRLSAPTLPFGPGLEVSVHTTATLPAVGDLDLSVLGPLQLGATLPFDAAPVRLTATLGRAGAALAALSALGFDGGAAGPAVATKASAGLTLRLGPVASCTLEVAVDGWQPVPGLGALDGTLTVTAHDVFGTAVLTTEVSGRMEVLGLEATVRAWHPPWRFRGSVVAVGEGLSVGRVLREVGLARPTGPGDGLLDVAVTEVRFDHGVDGPGLGLEVRLAGGGLGPLRLDDAWIRLRSGAGAVEAHVSLFDLDLVLSGTWDDAGLTLRGALGAGAELPLRAVVKGLAELTGSPRAAGLGALGDPTITDVVVTYQRTAATPGASVAASGSPGGPEPADAVVAGQQQTATDPGPRIGVAGRARLDVDGVPLGLWVSVHGGGGRPTEVVTSLELGGQRFDLALHGADAKSAAGSVEARARLEATYVPSGGRLDLTAVLEDLVPSLAGLGLPSVSVAGAELKWWRKVDGPPALGSRWAFQTTLASDLSAIGGAGTPAAGIDALAIQALTLDLAAPADGRPPGPLRPGVGGVDVPAPEPTEVPAGIGATLGVALAVAGTTYRFAYPLALASSSTTTTPAATSSSGPPAAGGSAPIEATGRPAQPLAPAVRPAPQRVGQQLGPLRLDRLGVDLDLPSPSTDPAVPRRSAAVVIAVDATVQGGGLALSLLGLALRIPLDDPLDVGVSLDGLGLAYERGPLRIAGSLARHTVDGRDEYRGGVRLGGASFTISAFGQYVPDDRSLFVFGVLDRDLGGPPAFRVTGLAGGYGYNQRLALPELDAVADHPLVQLAGGTAVGSPADGLDAGAAALAAVSTRSDGDQWAAFGVRFTSYGVVRSVAVVAISRRRNVTIDVLGTSTLALPAGIEEAGGTPIVYARMLLRATVEPERGVLAVTAKLTPDSYAFDPSCRLTGGFALSAWFADQPATPDETATGGSPTTDLIHAGDFVLTLGGYHPRFVRPAHYPEVAPLAFTWKQGVLDLHGSMYVALTPSLVMVGGRLKATWSAGGISAWFEVHADFLLAWKPFHYEAHAGITLGASFTVEIGALSVSMSISVGVDLHLWGPPFGGEAEVDLAIISFTIGFGEPREAPAALGWGDFEDDFLPLPGERMAVHVLAGLEREIPAIGDHPAVLVVNPAELVLATHSAVPLTSISFHPGPRTEPKPGTEKDRPLLPVEGTAPFAPVDVGPVGWRDLTSVQTVTIALVGDDPKRPYDAIEDGGLRPEPVLANLPSALWRSRPGGTADLLAAAGTEGELVVGALTGVRLTARTSCVETSWLHRDALAAGDEHEGGALTWSTTPTPSWASPAEAGETIDVTRRRRAEVRRQVVAEALGVQAAVEDRWSPDGDDLARSYRQPPPVAALGAR